MTVAADRVTLAAGYAAAVSGIDHPLEGPDCAAVGGAVTGMFSIGSV